MPRITITVENNPPQPYRFGLDRMQVTLGRGEDCDVMIECGSVSLLHAVMERVPRGYQLRDVGSTNGIELNGVTQSVIQLANGQDVKLGDVDFDFELSEEELAALALEDPPEEKRPPVPTARQSVAAPTPVPYRPPRKPQAVPAASEKNQTGINSLACLLAVIAFIFGMSVHFRKDTGQSLISVVNKRLSGTSVEVTPAEDAGAAPVQAASPANAE